MGERKRIRYQVTPALVCVFPLVLRTSVSENRWNTLFVAAYLFSTSTLLEQPSASKIETRTEATLDSR